MSRCGATVHYKIIAEPRREGVPLQRKSHLSLKLVTRPRDVRRARVRVDVVQTRVLVLAVARDFERAPCARKTLRSSASTRRLELLERQESRRHRRWAERVSHRAGASRERHRWSARVRKNGGDQAERRRRVQFEWRRESALRARARGDLRRVGE